jgi:hypothetical protein
MFRVILAVIAAGTWKLRLIFRVVAAPKAVTAVKVTCLNFWIATDPVTATVVVRFLAVTRTVAAATASGAVTVRVNFRFKTPKVTAAAAFKTRITIRVEDAVTATGADRTRAADRVTVPVIAVGVRKVCVICRMTAAIVATGAVTVRVIFRVIAPRMATGTISPRPIDRVC